MEGRSGAPGQPAVGGETHETARLKDYRIVASAGGLVMLGSPTRSLLLNPVASEPPPPGVHRTGILASRRSRSRRHSGGAGRRARAAALDTADTNRGRLEKRLAEPQALPRDLAQFGIQAQRAWTEGAGRSDGQRSRTRSRCGPRVSDRAALLLDLVILGSSLRVGSSTRT